MTRVVYWMLWVPICSCCPRFLLFLLRHFHQMSMRSSLFSSFPFSSLPLISSYPLLFPSLLYSSLLIIPLPLSWLLDRINADPKTRSDIWCSVNESKQRYQKGGIKKEASKNFVLLFQEATVNHPHCHYRVKPMIPVAYHPRQLWLQFSFHPTKMKNCFGGTKMKTCVCDLARL
jgi:hypothetical protein